MGVREAHPAARLLSRGLDCNGAPANMSMSGHTGRNVPSTTVRIHEHSAGCKFLQLLVIQVSINVESILIPSTMVFVFTFLGRQRALQAHKDNRSANHHPVKCMMLCVNQTDMKCPRGACATELTCSRADGGAGKSDPARKPNLFRKLTFQLLLRELMS